MLSLSGTLCDPCSLFYTHPFIRPQDLFVKYSQAFVVLPGGFGTMDELFEALTLVATGKITMFPIVLVGSDYWAPLLELLKNTMLGRGYIGASELDLFRVADDPAEVVKIIRKPTQASSSNRCVPARQFLITFFVTFFT